jgi:response regulator of citrate/malate metabolism
MATTIIILDDSVEFRKLMSMRLKSFIPDLSLTIFSSLAEARQGIRADASLQPDLVILDHHLPDGIGLELLNEERLQGLAILAVSSDADPEIPGSSMRAGATYFLSKDKVRDPSFKSLVLGLVDRNRTQRELEEMRRKATVIDTVKTLVETLRHEINNPLGAVLGAAFILKSTSASTEERQEAARLVEESGRRIKYVLEELNKAVSLDAVLKSDHRVFQVPGDRPWETKKG